MPNPPIPPKPPRRPLSEAELDALSQITASDVARARAAWESDAPPPFRKLLDAETDTPPEA